MNLYAEPSAVLAWLLSEAEAGSVKAVLETAELVTISDLTLIECDRVLIRGVALGEAREADAAARRTLLATAAAGWTVLQISKEIVDRSRRSFPGEPIRLLDAIHLASALSARAAVPGIEMLALDERIRRSARQLGFKLQPR